MNAVEIEEAVTELAGQAFDPEEFPYAFLRAFGNKETTIKRLRSGATNKSDISAPWHGVLQTNHIHIAVCPKGDVPKALIALRESPATTKAKARFVLATDGAVIEAEDLVHVRAPFRRVPFGIGFQQLDIEPVQASGRPNVE